MKYDFDALEFLGDAMLSKRWIFAKTMPKSPHWYTLRKEWKDDALFDRAVMAIRRVGYIDHYKGRSYTKFNMNGMNYWTMGAPIDKTILINRAEIKRPTGYDAIALKYDTLHTDLQSLTENKVVMDLLKYSGGSVLDIGCGTGLLLDYIQPEEYTGIDPSSGMLKVLYSKHPDVVAIQAPLEEYCGHVYDYAVSLFGAASHITPDAVKRIPSLGRKWFIMFYKDGYYPATCTKANINIPFYTGNHTLIPGNISELGNFYIVQGRQ